MLQGCIVLVVQSSSADARAAGVAPPDYPALVAKLIELDAQVIAKDAHANDVNYLESPASAAHASSSSIAGFPTHIVADTTEFIEYPLACASMIPVMTAQWVWDSASAGRLLNAKAYNPDPKYFLKDVFVCVADNLPAGDKETLYGGVRAFGGQYLDDLTRYTTHLVAVDMRNDKSVIAASAVGDIDIKIVTPAWLDECLQLGRKVDERPYLLAVGGGDSVDPGAGAGGAPPSSPPVPSSLTFSPDRVDASFSSTFLAGKAFYIAPDCNISPRLRATIGALIANNGGQVVGGGDPEGPEGPEDAEVAAAASAAPSSSAVPVPLESIDVYIGAYRAGAQYVACSQSNRIIVGTLQWLYFIVITGRWVLPYNSNLLHYPVPRQHVPGFKGLKVCITNYTGEARFYLSKLITTMGGEFTKTLTRENDYLVSAAATGKKYDAAVHKWRSGAGSDGPGDSSTDIKVVNHLWLEECYSKWALLDSAAPHYQTFKSGTDDSGVDRLIGRVRLDQGVLKKWWREESADGIDDSMSEDESVKAAATITTAVTPAKQPKKEKTAPAKRGATKAKPSAKSAEPAAATETTASPTTDEAADADAVAAAAAAAAADKENVPTPPARGGRSAKQKAAAKLHSDMADLNDYQQMSKSVTKMKHYMETLEDAGAPATPSKKQKGSSGAASSPSAAAASTAAAAAAASTAAPAAPTVVAVTTGCDDLNLSAKDLAALEHAGISILSDFSYKKPINTLIAPRIMRTEKFLKCLSQADQIVHPTYISDVLKRLATAGGASADALAKEFNTADYTLDKILGAKAVNQELGLSGSGAGSGLAKLLASPLKGKVFGGIRFNLSGNVNGGADVISKILEAHGSEEIKVVKTISSSTIKALVPSGDEVILIAHRVKDAKAIILFKKQCARGVVLDWDWCVKSIFKMHLEDYKKYRL